jgi:hypothetical protein
MHRLSEDMMKKSWEHQYQALNGRVRVHRKTWNIHDRATQRPRQKPVDLILRTEKMCPRGRLCSAVSGAAEITRS